MEDNYNGNKEQSNVIQQQWQHILQTITQNIKYIAFDLTRAEKLEEIKIWWKPPEGPEGRSRISLLPKTIKDIY